MRVDEARCFCCKACIPYCPVEAISMGSKQIAVIDEELCVECGNCQRATENICGAFYRPAESLQWPRVLRAALSDTAFVSTIPHVKSRGGTKKKANDVEGVFWPGDIGVQVELGRPNSGVSFRDVEKLSKVLAKLGMQFDPSVPITNLMDDASQGTFPEEVLNQRALTVYLSFTTDETGFDRAMEVILNMSQNLGTLMVVSLHRKAESGQELFPTATLNRLGLSLRPNGKVNLGLGRPAFVFSGRRNP